MRNKNQSGKGQVCIHYIYIYISYIYIKHIFLLSEAGFCNWGLLLSDLPFGFARAKRSCFLTLFWRVQKPKEDRQCVDGHFFSLA